MGFPAPGRVPVITLGDDGLWHCVDCDYTSPQHQSVLGHRGKHSTKHKRVGRPPKNRDPLNMSLSQLIDELDSLRKERDELTAALHAESKRNADIRHALGSFMQLQ